MNKLFILFPALLFSSCCDICTSSIPPLRQMQDWDEDNLPDILIIEGTK